MPSVKTIINIERPGRYTEEEWRVILSIFPGATRTEMHEVDIPIIERSTDKVLPLVQEEPSVVVDPKLKEKQPWETAPTRRRLPFLRSIGLVK